MAKATKTTNRSRKGIDDLLASAEWAARHAKGHAIGGKLIRVDVPDVRAIRRQLKLSQSGFARRFGLNVRTLQEWEQGRKLPDQHARILLRVISQSPAAVDKALAA
jgi:putative transcriptional regulator